MCDTIYNYYMIKNTYVDPNATIETHWRSIILLGKNVTSYKFSLAKSLLEFPRHQNLIRIDELALPFALNICEHLKLSNKQYTGPTNSFLEQCRKFNYQRQARRDCMLVPTNIITSVRPVGTVCWFLQTLLRVCVCVCVCV